MFVQYFQIQIPLICGRLRRKKDYAALASRLLAAAVVLFPLLSLDNLQLFFSCKRRTKTVIMKQYQLRETVAKLHEWELL